MYIFAVPKPLENLEMATIILLNGKIVLDVENGGGNVNSRLERILCPVCGDPACNSCWCGSEEVEPEEDADDVAARLVYNGALDGIESLILAQACVGIDVAAAEYQEAIQTALDAIGNKFS
jgi:hypothetical protein